MNKTELPVVESIGESKLINIEEDFERKYLLSLQALQDCMNEMGLRQDFYEYLMQIHAENAGARVAYFFRELKEVLKQKEPEDIFITNYLEGGVDFSEDLWFFLEGRCIKVTDFLVKEKPDRMKLISLEGEAQCIYITKNNFSFQTKSSQRKDTPSQLTITMKLENDEVLEFKAAQMANLTNCEHLFNIYQEYLAPLFPI